MINLFYDCYRVLSLVYKDGAYIRQAINDVDIEQLNRAKSTKICYGVLDKDIELSYYLSHLYDKSPKQPIKILLKIALYNIKYLQKKPYAVINNTVELAKKLGKGANSGFINAVLRKYLDSKIQLPNDNLSRLSVQYSYPLSAVELLVSQYGISVAEKIMAFDEEKTFVRFRKDIDGRQYLESNQISYQITPFTNLFSVSRFKPDDGFQKGIYTFQSIGSVAIAKAVDCNGVVLDACAAPGGKSVLIAETAEKVVSCEIHPHRLELIKSYIKRMGSDNVIPVLSDSSILNKDFLEKFDACLCDVPCSGYGTLKTNPDIKLKQINHDALTKTQYDILENCSNYIKKSGYLIYSTCTIFSKENDEIIERFLSEHKDFTYEHIISPLKGKKTRYGMQFLPHISCGVGFYFCKLKRI